MHRICAAAAILLLAGCGTNGVQTSSGAAYVAARPDFNARNGPKIDQAVERAARVEPLLRFPARIGIARIGSYGYQNADGVPPREADAWIAFAKSHADYGMFEQVSPLVMQMAQSITGDTASSIIDRIRLGAARQHLDAVLVYSVDESTSDRSTPLSVFNLTVIGAYLVPSHGIKGEAVASALLLDVRNGYPYGTATATGKETSFVPSIGSEDKVRTLTGDATVTAVANLTTEVDSMMSRLRTELRDKRTTTIAAKRASRVGHPASVMR